MMKVCKLYNKNDDTMVLNDLKLAETFLQRFLGLMGKTLEKSEGLMIKPCNSIHCFFMKIPIDVLFLDGDLQVIHKISGMKPWRVSPVIRSALAVIEGPEGAFNTIKLGDRVEME